MSEPEDRSPQDTMIKTAPKPVVVYKSLCQVLEALKANQDLPEIKSILRLCSDTGLLENKSLKQAGGPESTLVCSSSSNVTRPFIVLEGLDGTGKTTLAKFLSGKLNLRFLSTPPKTYDTFCKARSFFDGQPESLRRAYYSLGNYLAAVDVAKPGQPVVMDRYWHSTAAYAVAHQVKSGETYTKSDLIWPSDLLQPDLVIFLRVTEEDRLKRHATREDFTNTKEEQTLAADQTFRENLLQYYRDVSGPRTMEVFTETELRDSEEKILKTVLNVFPGLNERLQP